MSSRDEIEVGDHSRRFAGNAFWSVVGRVVAKVGNFAFLVIVARGLGREQYGYFVLTTSFASLFLMLGEWGLEFALLREVAKRPGTLSELFASSVVLRIGINLVALLVAGMLGLLVLPPSAPLLALSIVAGALFVDEMTNLVRAVFQAHEQSAYFASVMMVNRFASTALAAVALAAGGGLVFVAIMYLGGSITALTFGYEIMRRRFPAVRLRDASWTSMRELTGVGAPIGFSGFLTLVAHRVDMVLIQVFRGPSAVAMYGVAYRFLDSLLFIAWSFTSAAVPKLIRAERGEDQMRVFQLVATLLLAFYLPLAVGSGFAAQAVVIALFSERYADAASAITWLTVASVFYAVGHLARAACLTGGRSRPVTSVAVVTLAANLVLNVVAIPRYGFVAAAVVTCATELLGAVLLIGALVRQNGGFGQIRRGLFVPIIASAGMGLSLFALGVRGILAAAIGAALYAALLIAAARLLAPADFGLVKQLIRHAKRRPAPTTG